MRITKSKPETRSERDEPWSSFRTESVVEFSLGPVQRLRELSGIRGHGSL